MANTVTVGKVEAIAKQAEKCMAEYKKMEKMLNEIGVQPIDCQLERTAVVGGDTCVHVYKGIDVLENCVGKSTCAEWDADYAEVKKVEVGNVVFFSLGRKQEDGAVHYE